MLLRSGKEYNPLIVSNKNKNENENENVIINLRYKKYYDNDEFSLYDFYLIFSITLVGYVIIYSEVYPY